MKHFLVFLLIFIGIGSVSAQQAKITGTVKDNTGETIIGAMSPSKEVQVVLSQTLTVILVLMPQQMPLLWYPSSDTLHKRLP